MKRSIWIALAIVLLVSSAAFAPRTRVEIISPAEGFKLAFGGSVVLTANVEPADLAGTLTWSIVEGAGMANGRITTDRTTGVATYYAPLVSAYGISTRNLTIKAQVGDRTEDTAAITIGRRPTINFTATPNSIAAGSSSTLSWNVTNATVISLAERGGAPESVATAGSRTISPGSSTNYSITARNDFGEAVTVCNINVGSVVPAGIRITRAVSAIFSDLVVNDVRVSTSPPGITATDGTRLYQLGVEVRNDGPHTFNGHYSITARSVRADTGATYTSRSGEPRTVTIAKGATLAFNQTGPFVRYIRDYDATVPLTGWTPGTWNITCTITTDNPNEERSNNTSRAYTITLP